VAGVVFFSLALMIVLVAPSPAAPSLVTFGWLCAFLTGELMRFRTPTGKGNVSMAVAVHLAAIPLVPATVLISAAWIARLVADLAVKRSLWYRGLFNASQVTIAVTAAWFAFRIVVPEYGGVPFTSYLHLLAGLGAAAFAYYALNQGLVTGVLALTGGCGYFRTWRENFGYRVELVSSAALFLLSPVLTVMYQAVGFWSMAAFALPVLFMRDACERYLELRKAQRALIGSERLAAKGEMAASVAHEINNMLQVISGNLQLHLHHASSLAPDERLRFDRMQDALAKMRTMSQGLLEFSHRESRPIPTDLAKLVLDTVAFLRPQNRFDLVTVSTEVDERVGHVLVDPAQMQQVLTNLLFNAADAMAGAKTERPSLTVRLEWLESVQEVLMEVADNGPGIPDDIQHRIFEPGFTTKPDGHGFGLSTVFRIVKNHRGTIRVERSAGGGARFTLRIPAAAAAGVLRAA
jgi:signal transduction histidine kinase